MVEGRVSFEDLSKRPGNRKRGNSRLTSSEASNVLRKERFRSLSTVNWNS